MTMAINSSFICKTNKAPYTNLERTEAPAASKTHTATTKNCEMQSEVKEQIPKIVIIFDSLVTYERTNDSTCILNMQAELITKLHVPVNLRYKYCLI